MFDYWPVIYGVICLVLEQLSRFSEVASNSPVSSGAKMEPKSNSETVIAAADEVKKVFMLHLERKKFEAALF